MPPPGSQSEPSALLSPSLPLSHSLAVVLFGCSRRGRGGGKRGGKWRQRREGRGGRGKGPAYTGSEWKSSRAKNGERESLPSVSLSRREVRIPRTPCLPSSLHPEQQERKRRQRKGTREECFTGCIRLSHSETQGETEPCLCGEAQQSAARLPRLCEQSGGLDCCWEYRTRKREETREAAGDLVP